MQTQWEERWLETEVTAQELPEQPAQVHLCPEEPRTLVYHDTLHFQSFSDTFDNCLLIAYEVQGSVSSILLV